MVISTRVSALLEHGFGHIRLLRSNSILEPASATDWHGPQSFHGEIILTVARETIIYQRRMELRVYLFQRSDVGLIL